MVIEYSYSAVNIIKLSIITFMHISYLITSAPESPKIKQACAQLRRDIAAGFDIGQLFFYSDAVAIGSYENYPTAAEDLLDIADENDISATLCSAGFQLRQLSISDIGQQDFTFKGLGQFIAETQHAESIRHF